MGVSISQYGGCREGLGGGCNWIVPIGFASRLLDRILLVLIGSIGAHSGLGSRSQKNHEAQEARFKQFLALAPEIHKMTSRSSI